MLGLHQPLLINILGHAAGALLFTIFLGLLFSGRGWSGRRGRRLSGLAAGLSVIWNLGSLVVLIRPPVSDTALGIVIAVSFSVLSLLPAVLLHLALEGERPTLVAAGYLLSAVAVALHFWEILGNGARLHQVAIQLITAGFLILTLTAVAGMAFRGGTPPPRTRMVAAMCLALFAMSFIHFGTGHADQAWAGELLVHHAGIPLALFVLLQDYRFILLDAFVRFLANVLLAAVLTWVVIEAAFRLVLVEHTVRGPLEEALLLIGICLFLVLFAWLRSRVQEWLTRAVFRQTGATELAGRVRTAPPFDDEDRFIEWAASEMARSLRAERQAVISGNDLGAAALPHAPALASFLPEASAWAEVVAPVRLGEGSSRVILLGARQGGRRYLAQDLDALGRAAAEISTRIDSMRRREMDRLVNQAELRALQSQINPHFLFNALNTVYGTIPREAAAARRMVLNLADIFRYFLQTDRTFVPLSQEMQIVRAYLEVEQSRLAGRLTVEIHVDESSAQTLIPALSIQPLVENAIRHGVAIRPEPGYVRIRVECRDDELRVVVENSRSGDAPEKPGTGIALENVRRRLEICYGQAAGLKLAIGPEAAVAELSIPMARRPQPA